MEADSQQLIDAMDARVHRRNERRDLFRMVLGTAVGAGAFAYASSAAAQSTVTDPDILNFALNLEYLEAQFYSYAANNAGLPAAQLTAGASGAGTQGAVVINSADTGQPRGVAFQDASVAAYAKEIAADEAAHVAFLRTALGASAVPQPALNISGGANGAFTVAARAAGLIGPTATFDPYADDDSFLLAAFIFEDVGVTAYKGAAPLISNATFLEAAAGILAVEAYHAAIVRTTLYQRGADVTGLRAAADAISRARDSLDGTSVLDQGISATTVAGNLVSNIVPLDQNGIAFSRSPGQVLNIVYLNRTAVTMGGFFPAGVNGTIRAAAAN